MKVFFFFCFSFFVSELSYSQLPDGSTAPDFTLTDINGNSHNLYNYLSQNKTVFLDFFETWCGPCKIYHNSGSLQNLWCSHGPLGGLDVLPNSTDDIIVISIELNGSTTLDDLNGSIDGYNWLENNSYPIIDFTNWEDVNNFGQSYNVTYFPLVLKICPNKKIYNVGTQNSNVLYNSIFSCADNLGIQETIEMERNKIVIYSNSYGEYYLSVSGNESLESVKDIQILDYSGKIVHTPKINSESNSKYTFSLTSISSGCYLVRVNMNGQIITEKITVFN